MSPRRCPSCYNLHPATAFRILRDGRYLETRLCRFCLAAADIKHNREQAQRRRNRRKWRS